MKLVIGIIGGILLTLAAVAAIFLGYLGFFSSYTAQVKEMGPYTFVYESHIGPYSETKKVFDSVYGKLKKKGIATEVGMGIYYDHPSEVEASKLRSDCGSVIAEKEKKAFQKVRKEFKVKEIDKTKSVVVSFPVKNGFSYMVGPMKCYPLLHDYIKKNNLTPINAPYELYEVKKNLILFVMPVK
jgi:hypothetical protein